MVLFPLKNHWRSFFQDVVEYSPSNISCKMHDLMHDLAQSIMRLECVVVESGKGVKVPKMIRHLSYIQGTSRNDDVCKVRSYAHALIHQIITVSINILYPSF